MVFKTYWPQFEDGFAKAIEANQPSTRPEPRKDSDILVDILNSTRNLGHKIRDIESKIGLSESLGQKGQSSAGVARNIDISTRAFSFDEIIKESASKAASDIIMLANKGVVYKGSVGEDPDKN